MTTVRSGVPGHDDGTAFVRLRWGKLVDDPSGQRVWDKTTEGPYEIVCPGCGEDPSRDWSEISRNCAESGACTARRRAPRPRLWITSACRPADSHRPALARRRAAELQPRWVTEKIRENAHRPAVMHGLLRSSQQAGDRADRVFLLHPWRWSWMTEVSQAGWPGAVPDPGMPGTRAHSAGRRRCGYRQTAANNAYGQKPSVCHHATSSSTSGSAPPCSAATDRTTQRMLG